jgi:hypothetical protein
MARFALLWVIGLIVVLVGIGLFLFLPFSQASDIEGVTLKNQLTHLRETLKSDNLTTTNNETIKLQGEIDLKENLGSKWWNYLGTETFKTIIISVVLAVILALLGYIFKVNEIWETRSREQRKNRIDEQTESIKQTSRMWDDLYCIISKIRFYDSEMVIANNSIPNLDIQKRMTTIEDILEKLENFDSKAEEVVNTWHFLFPQLSKIGEEYRKKLIISMSCRQRETVRKKLEDNVKQELTIVNSEIKNAACQGPKKTKIKRKKELLVIQRKIDKKEKGIIFDASKTVTRALEKDFLVYFPNIRHSGLILIFINELYFTSSSVAYLIRKKEAEKALIRKPGMSDQEIGNIKQKEKEIRMLQDALGVIQDVVKSMVHQRMLVLLKFAVNPIEGWSENKKEEKNSRANISNTLTGLLGLAKKLMKIEYEIRVTTDNNGVDLGLSSIGDWEYKYQENEILKLAQELRKSSSKKDTANKEKWVDLLEGDQISEQSTENDSKNRVVKN